jgi:hypothetical protein
VIEGAATAHREYAVTEFLDHTALVEPGWKVEFEPDGRPALLFDRVADPMEQVNLADDRRHAGVLAGLTERLAAFRAATPVPPVRATHGA